MNYTQKQKELTEKIFGPESPQMIDAHIRLGHTAMGLHWDAEAYIHFEDGFNLSKKIYGNEENGTCVIAMMNMAIAMRYL